MLANRTPRFGNDDQRAVDRSARFESYWKRWMAANTRGRAYRINMLPTTCHIYFGSVMRPPRMGAAATCR